MLTENDRNVVVNYQSDYWRCLPDPIIVNGDSSDHS